MNSSSGIVVAVVAVLLVLCICLICVFLGVGALLIFNVQTTTGYDYNGSAPEPVIPDGATPTPVVIGPSLDSKTQVPTDTLTILENTIVPINDLTDLAERLAGKSDIPTTLVDPAAPYSAGQQKTFWVTNTDTNENFQVDATLQYVTDHVYFWVEDGVRTNQDDLVRLADTFENEIYPTDREFFGSEWTPGVDEDPHLYILYARGLGSSLAGYFSSADEYHPDAHEYSNAHEMFLLSADNVDLDEEFAYSVLAHEFQHMIHWYRDRNEETWMNEGFSELASFLNQYDVGGTDWVYTMNPDIQLTFWPEGPGNSAPHYGASFLFLTYFLDRFGEDATKAVVAEPSNGMVSIDKVLAEIGATDPVTEEPVTADSLFSDWVVASFLQDPNAADGRYTYHNYLNAPQPSETETISSCPSGGETRDVTQYGVDYIRIECSGNYNLHFEGSNQVNVVPADAYSGEYAFWSNQGDESDMTLTHNFDFSDVEGPLTFNYWTWYDLEKDYDYLYLVASTDGENWEILTTPSGTSEDPSGNSYGWAYNGKSGGGGQAKWIQESVDISQFAGQEVQLRFEYVTDAAVNGEGLLLDDVSIPEVDYNSDFESDDGGWVADGFVRMRNVLPQTFRLSLIRLGAETTVEQFDVSGTNAVDIPLELSGDVDEAVLVVSGTTRFTRQKAPYRFDIQAR